jgi:hypothetical protein
VGVLLPFIGGLWLAIYIEYILQRGFKVDAYDPIPEINVLDLSHTVFNTLPEDIPSGAGVVVDNTQPYPIFGWLDAKWIPGIRFRWEGRKRAHPVNGRPRRSSPRKRRDQSANKEAKCSKIVLR